MWWRKLNLLISKQGVLSPTLFAGFGALQLTLMEVWLICHNELHLVLFALFLPSPVTGVPILALGNDVGGGLFSITAGITLAFLVPIGNRLPSNLKPTETKDSTLK